MGDDPKKTTAPMPGRGFSYRYDTAGNRTSVSVDSESASYTPNSLNQITSRDTLKTRVSGTASADAVVTVGGAAASRQGRYWDAKAPLSSAGQSSGITISATLDGSSGSSTVTALQRPASETLTYDSDGNLTDDSLWHYDWDAENRLKKISTAIGALGWAPDKVLQFTYDYLGRRVRKESWLNGTKVYDHKFVYSGWTVIADIDEALGLVVRTYVWGLPQQGGNVGALILETEWNASAGTLTAFNVAYDGSGNVTALIDNATGVVAATYEYDPFGQILRLDGDQAAKNPFRFSTYYTDHETGLIYYGLRYYDPSLGRFINRDPIG
jgi:RHS repeat-associated protein